MSDVAGAIGGLAKAGVTDADITPTSFGHACGRGFLLKLSAGQVNHHLACKLAICVPREVKVFTSRAAKHGRIWKADDVLAQEG